MARYQENNRRKRMWFGTQHHSEWVTCPLRGAEMTPESWGLEGTYLSGGGFVRQSQDSHRQYIFEWSGASSRSSAEIMQAYRDGVYNKAPSDLIYFIDPLVYSRNILPKRWAQPGILTVPGEAEYSPIGVVTPVDTPVSMLGNQRVPMVGAQVSSPITSLNDLNSKTSPGVGSVWVPIPDGETLKVVAWTGNPLTSESGLYVKAQESDGSWRNVAEVGPHGVKVSGAKGVLLATVGTFDFYGARAVIGRGEDWSDPVTYAWTGAPDNSTSTRTDVDGTVTNLFTNPDMVATSGEVVVWENLVTNAAPTSADGYTGSRGDISFEGDFVRLVANETHSSTRAQISGHQYRPVVTPGETYTFSTEVRSATLPSLRLYVYFYDADNSPLVADTGDPQDIGSEWTRISHTFTTTADTASVALWWNAGGLLEEGEALDIRRSSVTKTSVAVPYFDEAFSPDPDLTPQVRPGGGSQLVGQQIAGLSASGGVVVQSTQWSKSGGKSARFINNAGDDLVSYASVSDMGDAETVVLHRYQDKTLPDPSAYSQYTGGAYFPGSPVNISPLVPNEPGEHLIRFGREEGNTSPYLRLWGAWKLGESVWFDFLTIVDESYDGPPFSGSSPTEGPKWLPGSGNSGCKFVGNPTWIANSGVNGGQIGYAATLKEVGDWQL